VRTADGGRSFTRLPAPPLPTDGTVGRLRFANRRDGFAYVSHTTVLYATHDGGVSWRRLALGDVLDLTTAAGNVYAVTARCSVQGCSRYRFERRRATENRFTMSALPFTPDGPVVDLAARGTKVWLLGTRAGNGPMMYDELARSNDRGRTFVTGRGPCYAGLGGELLPVSATVVWAVCPGGLLSTAWRSHDGGVTFTRLTTPPMANPAELAPASAKVAVLAGNGAGLRLLRTADGGRTWKAARTPAPAYDFAWIGFTSARVGTALVQTGDARPNALWRTTDGGAEWSTVPLRQPR
jgi:photosystem II stability/assembly factor-like uncharacterized protein